MIVQKFQRQAAAVPGNVAIYTGNEEITYQRLNQSANRLAHYLLPLLKRSPGDAPGVRGGEETVCIGLMLEYGAPQVTAALAVLKARAMYAPLDADYPVKRLAFMIGQSGAAVILTDSGHLDIASQAAAAVEGNAVDVICIDRLDLEQYPVENIEWSTSAPKDLMAYIIYTSGSTGESKGVAQTCENAVFHVENYIKSLSITAADKLSYVSSFSHDGAVEDIFGALFTGASICPLDIRSGKGYGVEDLARWVMENNITLWHCIVTVFRYAAQEITAGMEFPSLRVIVLGGEKIRLGDIETARRFFPHVTFAHWYGMTESSVNTMAVVDKDQRIERITIGGTVPGVEILVLNDEGEEVDPFQVGEIFILSKHIAPGYWKNPDATAKAFIQSEELGPVYRTGDLGKPGLDGSIEFMGRKDHQVKIRGFRVELGEIEHALQSYPGIEAAAVTARQNRAGETYLCGYFVASDPQNGPVHGDLTGYLAGLLPDYMAPAVYQPLDAMPMTTTGKIDRKALPEPAVEREENYTAPSTDMEIKLAGIFSTVLFGRARDGEKNETEQIGIDDNFFHLGGHSLKATQLISHIHKTFDVKVPLGVIFDNPTIRGLAAAVSGSGGTGGFEEIEPVEKREYYPVTPAQQRFYFLHRLTPGSIAFNLPLAIPVAPGIDKQALEQAFIKLVHRHESLRTRFEIVDEQAVLLISEPPDVTLEIEYRTSAEGFVRPFDLSAAPLFRAALIQYEDERCELMVDFHHIISDGTSRQVLTRDFTALFAGEELPPLRIQYKDFSCWMERRLRDESGGMAVHEAFWLDQLKAPLPLMDIPVDFPRPEVRQTQGAHYYMAFGTGLTRDITRLTGSTGATFYMVLLAVYNIILSRYTGQYDIIVGSPIAGRYHADLEDIIGLVIGSVIMRNRPEPNKNFNQFLEEIKTNTLAAYENQAYPFEELLRKLDWEDVPGHEPLSDAALIVQNQFDANTGPLPDDDELQGPEPRYASAHEPSGSKLDITLYAVESGDNIVLLLEYATSLFKPDTIERLARHIVSVMQAVTASPGIRLADIDMTGKEEKIRLTGGDYPFYPLTHPQKRVYQNEQVYEGTPINNLAFSLRYPRILDEKILEKAINTVIAKNDGLRLRITRVEWQDEPFMYFLPHDPYLLESVDFSHLPENERDEALNHWINRQVETPFDFLNNRLFRFVYIRFNEKESGFLMNFHHIVLDGWSMDLMLDQLNECYFTFEAGGTADPEPGVSYTRFLEDERAYLQSGQSDLDRESWLKTLLPLPEDAELPTTAAQANLTLFNAKSRTQTFILPDDLRNRIIGYSNRHRMSIYKIFLGAVSIYLSRFTRRDDIVIGGAGHNRTTADQRKIIGMFVSTFPLRITFDHGKSFDYLVQNTIDEQVRKAKKLQVYPFDLLMEDIREITGINPRLQSIDVIAHGEFENEHARLTHHFQGQDPTPLVIHTLDIRNAGILQLEWISHLEIFSPGEIERMHNSILAILDYALEHPEQPLERIPLLGKDEKQQILFDFNRTEADPVYPPGKLAHQLFEDCAEKYPDHIAVVFGGSSLSYRELNKRAELLAGGLAVTGVGSDSIVALMIDSCLEMVIGLLGILKSGGAYLPVSPSFPEERINYILKDSNAMLLLSETFPSAITVPTLSIHSTSLFGNRRLSHFPAPISPVTGAPDEDGEHVPAAPRRFGGQLAYVIYTSGTTGRPKGVLVEHRNLLAYVNSFAADFPIDSADVALQQASFTFDAFVEEFYPVLLNGGKLVVPRRDEVMDTPRLSRFIRRHHVTLISVSPLMLDQLNRGNLNELSSIRVFISGGDRLASAYVDNLVKLPNAVVYNTYGPTESTVCATYHRCQPGGPSDTPIGKPIANYKTYILDCHNLPLPTGIPGELCIAGPGVTRGYLNRPELTAEKFILAHSSKLVARREEEELAHREEEEKAHSSKLVARREEEELAHSSKLIARREEEKKLTGSNEPSFPTSYELPATSCLYKTGDLCKWDHNGNILFLGRIDRQVKVRGYRIELGEIESRLNSHDHIRDSVVLDRVDKGGGLFLCAYLVLNGSGARLDAAALREYLKISLPDYMVPARFVTIDKIPLTISNKIDKRALPEPGSGDFVDTLYTPPRDTLDNRLLDIWHRVLGIDREKIGIDANFFDLGGHSLKVASLAARIHKELDVRIGLPEIFQSPTIRGLAEYIAEYIKTSGVDRFASITPVEKREFYPLSYAQKRMYIIKQLDSEGVGYNMPQIFPLGYEQDIDTAEIKNAFMRLIERHESLRTSFHSIGGDPVQKVHDTAGFNLHVIESGDIRTAFRNFIRPFDLSHAPLLRVSALIMPDRLVLLMTDMHHIISDGISVRVLTDDFKSLYFKEELPSLSIHYKDFAVWQQEGGNQELIARQETYWLDEFSADLPVLDIPTDFPRPPVQGFEGDSVIIELETTLSNRLRQLASRCDATVYMTLLAAFHVLLARLSGNSELVTGTVVAGRQHADLEAVIGMFVNTLAIKTEPVRGKRFMDFMSEVKEKTVHAFENQEYPFEELVEKIDVPRDASRNPVFDVLFALQEVRAAGPRDENADSEGNDRDRFPALNPVAKFDLTLTARDSGDDLSFVFEYCTDLFREETILRFTRYFKRILSAVASGPGHTLGEIEIMSDEEKQQVLFDFNDTRAGYPRDKTVHEIFEEQVERHPDRTALFLPGEPEVESSFACHVTYGELNRRSGSLACTLKENGAGEETLVAFLMDRSVEMIVTILAILKTGGAYLPLDPIYPEERIKYILQDSHTPIVVTDTPVHFPAAVPVKDSRLHICPLTQTNRTDSLQTRPQTRPQTASPGGGGAYIIYTSGTTGKPKGVIIEHGNVVRLMTNDRFRFEFSPGDTWSLFHSICFDFSVWEMYGALLYGGKLVLVPMWVTRDTGGFLELLKRERVTVLNQTPSAFYQLAELESAGTGSHLNLRYVIFGGEALHPGRLADFNKKYPGVKLINMYGITETTVHVTFKEIGNDDIRHNISNIGLPIPTLTTYVMDPALNLQPIGVAGECCVGGDGVARGYLNRPELTGEKFVPDPNNPGQRLYRSGDLVRRLPGGEMEYLGRIDRQVQVRGFRVELGEIENRVAAFDGVRQSVVVNYTDTGGLQGLCAYMVAAGDQNVDVKKLKEYLNQTLPVYMVPQFFVEIESIPLTPNGKVNRKKLPRPELKTGKDFVNPRNEKEKQMTVIWAEAIGIPVHVIGIDSNFFDLGGNSLKLMKVHSRLKEAFDVAFSVVQLFTYPTIRGLCEFMDSGESQPAAAENRTEIIADRRAKLKDRRRRR